MNLLLDTHVALWALAAPERLGAESTAALADRQNVVAVSAASVWEVGIKRALGKLDAPDEFDVECVERGFDELPITAYHAACAGSLPPHHSDPFDRMLIAQAIVDRLTIVTVDPAFSQYEVAVIDPRR